MSRKKTNVHYIYKTTCNITNKYYIGMHSTSNMDDDYLGSGKRLRYSIRKHGKENHTKEILEYCEDRDKLAKREKEIVCQELSDDVMCMNLCVGGFGGFQCVTKEQIINNGLLGSKKLQEKLKNDKDFYKNQCKKISDGIKIAVKEGRFPRGGGGWNKGKELSDEHKKNIGAANSIKQKGELNSQYGMCWINKNGNNKQIIKEELNSFLLTGWRKGKQMITTKLLNEMIDFYKMGNSYQKLSNFFNIPNTNIKKYLKGYV